MQSGNLTQPALPNMGLLVQMRYIHFILNCRLKVNDPPLFDIKQCNYVDLFKDSFGKFEELLNHKNEDFFCKTFATPYFQHVSEFRIFFSKRDKPGVIFS